MAGQTDDRMEARTRGRPPWVLATISTAHPIVVKNMNSPRRLAKHDLNGTKGPELPQHACQEQLQPNMVLCSLRALLPTCRFVELQGRRGLVGHGESASYCGNYNSVLFSHMEYGPRGQGMPEIKNIMAFSL